MVSPLHNPHIPSLENRIGTGEEKKKIKKSPKEPKQDKSFTSAKVAANTGSV